jgi:membrane protease YdiL (CAAX protease family)
MDKFQLTALFLTAVWFLGNIAFRRSRIMLLGGLLVIGLYALGSVLFGEAVPEELGLSSMVSWPQTIIFALAGLAVTLACSPIADRIASRWFPEPPYLETFRAIQKSKVNLGLGIVTAWVLGGFLEEMVARGIVLTSLHSALSITLPDIPAAAVAIVMAAAGAGAMHLYQGKRAMAIITQISILFGVIFVISGYNLMAVIICHGLYDTIAFIRFAGGRSLYSKTASDT